jgi:NADH-quinone oxidoreductase subunit A
MTELVGYLILFVAVGVFFLFFHLMVGKLVRPNKPDADKLTIYECGEPTIGSAWVQFDLRFYVVALLFVIFDVEVAFFFPWAVVFGKANALAKADLTAEARMARARELDPNLQIIKEKSLRIERKRWEDEPEPISLPSWIVPAQRQMLLALRTRRLQENFAAFARMDRDISDAAHQLAWFAFWDIAIFFAVLLVGFAYLWRRGDLDWVRSMAAEKVSPAEMPPPTPGLNGGLIVSAGLAPPAEVAALGPH